MRAGKGVEALPALAALKEQCKQELAAMRSDHLRALNPTPYKVSGGRGGREGSVAAFGWRIMEGSVEGSVDACAVCESPVGRQVTTGGSLLCR